MMDMWRLQPAAAPERRLQNLTLCDLTFEPSPTCAAFGQALPLGDGQAEGGMPARGVVAGPPPPAFQQAQPPANKRKFTGLGAGGAAEKLPRSQGPENGSEGSL